MTSLISDATENEINTAVERSWQAFHHYRKLTLKKRAEFIRAIAAQLDTIRNQVLPVAHKETNLDIPRLEVEFNRTLWQLTSYADACENGAWLDIRIDTAKPQRDPPKPDLRKMLVPLGPVVVFGASNFPFAYSTAGGDTACALAAGSPVLLKAHPAHFLTSELVASAVQTAAEICGLTKDIFIHVAGSSFKVGEALVMHPLVKAVGFTGSLEGGKALYDLAAKRKEPIPVFAEMGSINPVFLLSQKLQQDADKIAKMYATSITQSGGQFCTNPGLMVGIKGPELTKFIEILTKEIQQIKPVQMLHSGIAKSFQSNRNKALDQQEVQVLAKTKYPYNEEDTIPTIASVPASGFLKNPLLHKEVFGPYSLLVVCENLKEMYDVANNLDGQLTTTIMATEIEMSNNVQLIDALQLKCGRIIFNGVPTGVEVALAMQHGGPYPATTDSRFTAVGADGIKRFARPVCYQGWPDELLPEELKNINSLKIWRTVNNELTNQPII